MNIVQFINEKILDPFIEAHAIAPRMAAREKELQARVAELREQALQAQEQELQAKEEELRVLELRVRAQELQVREEELRTREAEAQARLVAGSQARFTAEVARNNEQWAAWLARRDAALAQGQPFDEPRPDGVCD